MNADEARKKRYCYRSTYIKYKIGGYGSNSNILGRLGDGLEQRWVRVVEPLVHVLSACSFRHQHNYGFASVLDFCFCLVLCALCGGCRYGSPRENGNFVYDIQTMLCFFMALLFLLSH